MRAATSSACAPRCYQPQPTDPSAIATSQPRAAGPPFVEWPTEESPFRPIGRITLMRQLIETPARDAFCEGTAFNPWNAPETHAPLGSMNEVRRSVYDKISAYRRQRNGVTAIDARSAWEN